MRLTATLLAIAVVLLTSSDKFAAASKATTTKNGFYAEFYNVENGVVTDKMRVPLGDGNQYKQSDFKELKKSLTNQEERAAVHLPRGFNSLFKGFEKFASLFTKRHRRLRIDEA
ncbi:Hypothetical protein PHPALM_37260 [Phytophthora palmivora]|uniref:RxLR effector protein n=1 Tax=Phytophthora palmivora TaxID=4796 RepID=A0A2P4WXX2_9STRA|nr:Hypothetical protein PHPALM_37260 [Phytophthora palmivora]